MGVNHLWSILEPAKRECRLEEIANKRLCVDLSYWVCELAHASHGSLATKPYLRGLFHRVRTLLGLNCTLIFVIDGEIPAIKLPAYRQRLECPSRTSRPALQPKPIEKSAPGGRRSKSSEFARMVAEAAALARALGVAVLASPEEAEAQCAILNAAGLCDICCTGDSDSFLFGATHVLRDLTILPGRSTCELYSADRIQQVLGYGRNSLIALGVLLGSDYAPKFHGLNKVKAARFVQALGDARVLCAMKDGGVRHLAAARGAAREGATAARRKPPRKAEEEEENGGKASPTLNEQTLAEQCMEAYLHPKCHQIDSDPLRKALGQPRLVRLDDLAELLRGLMGWPNDVTAKYVLPKLAERDLRRKVLAMELSEDSTPASVGLREAEWRDVTRFAEYRVERVVKRHVHYGRPFYAVAWSGTPAVTDSIVEASLVERAYPEKIAEFRAQKSLKVSTEKSMKSSAEVGCPARSHEAIDDCSLAALSLSQSAITKFHMVKKAPLREVGLSWERKNEEITLLGTGRTSNYITSDATPNGTIPSSFTRQSKCEIKVRKPKEKAGKFQGFLADLSPLHESRAPLREVEGNIQHGEAALSRTTWSIQSCEESNRVSVAGGIESSDWGVEKLLGDCWLGENANEEVSNDRGHHFKESTSLSQTAAKGIDCSERESNLLQRKSPVADAQRSCSNEQVSIGIDKPLHCAWGRRNAYTQRTTSEDSVRPNASQLHKVKQVVVIDLVSPSPVKCKNSGRFGGSSTSPIIVSPPPRHRLVVPCPARALQDHLGHPASIAQHHIRE